MNKQIEMMNYLETLRKKAKISIGKLIEGIIPSRQYSRYLSGSAEIPLQTLSEVLERLHLTLFEFSAYQTNHIMVSNYEEIEFWVLIQNEKYELAYQTHYPKLVNKTLKSHIASQAIPLGIKLVEYKNNRCSHISALEEMKNIIQLDKFLKHRFVTDNDIISLYIYVQICSDEDKNSIISFMLTILEKGVKHFLVTNMEELLTIFYITLLYALTTRKVITIEDRKRIQKVTSEWLEYHSRSKLANYDVKFFGILYRYIKKHHIHHPHIVYYYIASILSNFGDECVKDTTFEITKEDMELYLALIQDDEFMNHPMYEGVKTDDL